MKFTRNNKLCEKLIILDGLHGTGKSVLAPIIGSLRDVEKQIVDKHFNTICALSYMNKIDDDAVKVYLQLYTDISIYNSMISREINFRPSDNSSIFNNPNSIQYIKRFLSNKEGKRIVNEIKEKEKALFIVTNTIFQTSKILFKTFKSDCFLIKLTRHPLYIIDKWLKIIDNKNKLSQFLMVKDKSNNLIPWYATEIKNYSKMSSLDKAIHLIYKSFEMQNSAETNMSNYEKKNCIVIPYELFIFNSETWIIKIIEKSNLVTSELTKHWTKKMIKNKKKLLIDKNYHDIKLNWLIKNSSSESYNLFKKISDDYSLRYKLLDFMP